MSLIRHQVTREEAMAAWNNSDMHHLFTLAFNNFEQYWNEVKVINKMSDITYLATVRQAQNLANVR